MNVNYTDNQSKAKDAVARLAVTLAIACAVAGQTIAVASPAIAQITPDQDALLPPEVVPYEQQAATRLPQAQPTTGENSNPLVNQFANGKAARDLRQQAFQSLMNRDELWQNASQQYLNQMNAQMAEQQLQAQTLAQQNSLVANSVPAQTQTLSGRPTILPTKGINRTPFTHGTTSAILLGGSLYNATASRGSAASLYSLGILGVGMGNYMFRNGFRF